MENKISNALSEKEFLKWAEKEAERDLKSLTKEELEEFQRALELGKIMAQRKCTPAIREEWQNLLRKARLRNGNHSILEPELKKYREKLKHEKKRKKYSFSTSKEIVV